MTASRVYPVWSFFIVGKSANMVPSHNGPFFIMGKSASVMPSPVVPFLIECPPVHHWLMLYAR